MKFLIFVFLLFICKNIKAQDEPIDTDRPDQTESPVTVKKYWMQIEHGFGIERDNKISTTGSSTLFRYGLLQNFELRLETDFIHTPSTKYSSSTTKLQPITMGTKVSLWQPKNWLPKTSLLIHVGIPFLAAKSFKNLNAAPGIILAFQNNLSQIISWGYNIGAEWDGENSDPTYIYTFSNGIDVSEKLYGFLEIYGSLKNDGLPQHNIDAGLSLLINNNIKLDISSGAGITNAAPDWSIAIGASIRFNIEKK